MALSMTNIVYGNVVNDYGLDNVPYTIGTTGSSTCLLAYVGWDVAQQAYQATGKSPAVNVTDSAGNLWRQIGISTVCTQTRGALWIADNPRQVEWVSVALTGWGYSTAYQIMEMDGVPTSMGAISLDFVKTFNTTSFTTTLSIASTATTTDIAFGLLTTGGNGGALTIPTGWTGIGGSFAGGTSALDTSTYAMWIPTQGVGVLPVFDPSWANSVPSTGIVVGLKQTSTAPTMRNPNMPVVTVEAAFGALPGDYTQSVDYTFDIQGLTWTDISSRAFAKGDDGNIKTKRGRQYELSQEEAGELDVMLDNHDGALTSGNTTSVYYPNVIPGTPIRVTAWWQGVQYPIMFGYVQKWPQAWPDMPQWGFSIVEAVDAYGVIPSASLPSAVEGDIIKEAPYFYFPTAEQYEFTTQSLTPTASPIDANGLIAVNYAFGNNRYGAYRDGSNEPGTNIPVTVGQALNLLGDQNTTLGVTTYQGQAVEVNGPGMFYFDPNIPTNFNNAAFSVEFWFVWGNTNTYSCELLSAFGRPSSFYASTPQTAPTNGGVLAVGVNTSLAGATVLTSGFYCNGVELTNGQFDQDTFAPQHFALSTGPNGTTTYLNGVATANQPGMGNIPQIKAVALGPARFSYDQSDMIAYNAFNYIAGHVAWYAQELTAQQISNHYESGISGWAGVPAPGRYAQTLTWGRLGLKRGGTAWYQIYGDAEGTYMSEAYDYQGSSAADIMNQLVTTEGGRCYTQANGSLVYAYRWQQYNQGTVATFTDNITALSSGNNFPYEQNTAFSLDNQFIYNQVTSTQQRGPDQDFFVQQTDFPSYTEYFLRSGLQIQSYALLPFDVFDVVNWNLQKFKQPTQRVMQLMLDVTRTAAKFPNLFPVILGLELNQTIVVTRTPIGGATMTVAGVIQEITHDIGATYWKTGLQITPVFPENATLIADVAGQNTPNTQYLSW